MGEVIKAGNSFVGWSAARFRMTPPFAPRYL
jgi:hypothetical protein